MICYSLSGVENSKGLLTQKTETLANSIRVNRALSFLREAQAGGGLEGGKG